MKKSILITGSTDGIGKLAAITLAKEGHEIYLHGRNEEKLKQVILEIKNLSNNDLIKGFVADFSDLSAVTTMAKQVIEEVPKLDVLINNAGVYKSRIQQTPAGLDMRFAVNYFAPYLLTKLLLPLLKKGDQPRLVNLSSAAQATVANPVLTGEVAIPDQSAYAQSKLAITMWSFHLAKAEPEIAVIAVNPGSLLNTNMVREGFGRFWSPAEKGGDILAALAVSDAYSGVTGKYFDNDQGGWGTAHSDAYNAFLVNNLISSTDQILGEY